jgi:hypothetical protein
MNNMPIQACFFYLFLKPDIQDVSIHALSFNQLVRKGYGREE